MSSLKVVRERLQAALEENEKRVLLDILAAEFERMTFGEFSQILTSELGKRMRTLHGKDLLEAIARRSHPPDGAPGERQTPIKPGMVHRQSQDSAPSPVSPAPVTSLSDDVTAPEAAVQAVQTALKNATRPLSLRELQSSTTKGLTLIRQVIRFLRSQGQVRRVHGGGGHGTRYELGPEPASERPPPVTFEDIFTEEIRRAFSTVARPLLESEVRYLSRLLARQFDFGFKKLMDQGAILRIDRSGWGTRYILKQASHATPEETIR